MENGWGGEGMGMRFGWRSGGGGDETEREQRAMPGTGRAGLTGEGTGLPRVDFRNRARKGLLGLLGWGCGKGWGWARRGEGEQSGGEGRRGAGAERPLPAAMRGSPPGRR